MWIEVKVAPNLMLAEMWKEFFEAEGIPARLLPEGSTIGEKARYRVLIPELKKHMIDEIMRKI